MGDHAGAIPYYDADVLQPLNAYPSVFDRSAEQAIAADRFARKIVGILKAVQALAAAERPGVGRLRVIRIL
jgi:hypothetical protein